MILVDVAMILQYGYVMLCLDVMICMICMICVDCLS